MSLKERAEDGGRIVLAFEGLHKHLGDLFGALGAGGGGFRLVGEFTKLATLGRGHRVEQFADLAVCVEGADELGWENNRTFDEIGFKPDLDARTEAGVGTGLHLLVDEEKVAAAARIGKERSAEREAGDFAADATAIAQRPGLGDVEGDTGDDPLERRSVGLEERGEGFAR